MNFDMSRYISGKKSSTVIYSNLKNIKEKIRQQLQILEGMVALVLQIIKVFTNLISQRSISMTVKLVDWYELYYILFHIVFLI